jgi:hypothetical protein
VGELIVGDELSPRERRMAVAVLLASGVWRWKRFYLESVSATSVNSLRDRLVSRRKTRLSVSQAVPERSSCAADRLHSNEEGFNVV